MLKSTIRQPLRASVLFVLCVSSSVPEAYICIGREGGTGGIIVTSEIIMSVWNGMNCFT